jgi:hypothetical protein
VSAAKPGTRRRPAERGLAVFLVLLGSACATIQPSHRDERFVIFNLGNFTAEEIQRVRAQLEIGTRALERYMGPAPATKFPIVVNVWPGRGVSHSHHGQGAIELYWVREGRAPIIHELTHVLAGYTAANGHWTQEGFASYMQDQYGEDEAFPTQRMAHALVKVLGEEGRTLPMLEVMRDRNRAKYFGLRTPWERWVAYTQSTSFSRYLIERYEPQRFLKLYDAPFEAIDFRGLYGQTAEALVNDWLSYVSQLPGDTTRARAIAESMRGSLGRR